MEKITQITINLKDNLSEEEEKVSINENTQEIKLILGTLKKLGMKAVVIDDNTETDYFVMDSNLEDIVLVTGE